MYFLPVQGSKDEKVRRKSKAGKGLFKIKLKKGTETLNVDSQTPDYLEKQNNGELSPAAKK